MLYLLHLHQNDANANFKNEFHNLTKVGFTQNLADPKVAVHCAVYLERSVWWNNPQIRSEFSQTTHIVHQSWRPTFWTFD